MSYNLTILTTHILHAINNQIWILCDHKVRHALSENHIFSKSHKPGKIRKLCVRFVWRHNYVNRWKMCSNLGNLADSKDKYHWLYLSNNIADNRPCNLCCRLKNIIEKGFTNHPPATTWSHPDFCPLRSPDLLLPWPNDEHHDELCLCPGNEYLICENRTLQNNKLPLPVEYLSHYETS